MITDPMLVAIVAVGAVTNLLAMAGVDTNPLATARLGTSLIGSVRVLFLVPLRARLFVMAVDSQARMALEAQTSAMDLRRGVKEDHKMDLALPGAISISLLSRDSPLRQSSTPSGEPR